jgi:hypothetical protein
MMISDDAGWLALLAMLAGPALFIAYCIPACRRAHTPHRPFLLAVAAILMPIVFVAISLVVTPLLSPDAEGFFHASPWARTWTVFFTALVASVAFTLILRGGARWWTGAAAFAATVASLPWHAYTNGDPLDPVAQAVLWPQIAWHTIAAIGLYRWATHHRAIVRRDRGHCPICNRRRADLDAGEPCPRCGASPQTAGPPAARL